MTFGGHETGVAEYSQVTGNRWPARIEAIGDLSRCEGTIAQESKNLSPGFIGERAEWPIRCIRPLVASLHD
jgi:hypothetical protein